MSSAAGAVLAPDLGLPRTGLEAAFPAEVGCFGVLWEALLWLQPWPLAALNKPDPGVTSETSLGVRDRVPLLGCDTEGVFSLLLAPPAEASDSDISTFCFFAEPL